MPSTYTANLGIEKPATGEQGGVWGVTANNSYDFLDQSTDGNVTIALSASSYNLNTLQGAASQGRAKVIIFNGTLTQDSTINITPNTAQKIYFFTNATAGGFNVRLQQGSGSVFTLQPGHSAMVYCDGLGNAASVNGANYNPQFGSVLITGALTVSGALSFSQVATFSQAATFAGPTTLNGTTTAAGLVIATGAPAAYDLYYRAPSGLVSPLPIGAPGQLLGVSGLGTPVWANVALGVGSAISGAAALGVFFASGGGTLAQDPSFRWNPNVGLGIGLQAAYALHVGGALPGQIWIDAAAAATRQLVWATAGLARWALTSPVSTESGGNAGSNLGFASFADGGGQLGWAMMMFRSSGHVSIGTSADGGCQLFVANASAGQPALVVRGAVNQSQPLQIWQNSNGTTMASMDQNGVLTSAGGGGGSLSLNAQGRLDLWGTVGGHPLGTLHIGPEASGFGTLSSSIVMEFARQGPDNMPPGAMRMYYRNNQFVIQFYYNGTQYFATLALVGNPGNPVTWYISPTAI